MRKIVINSDFGGFGLSDAAEQKYMERSGSSTPPRKYDDNTKRDCPILVAIVEEMGEAANAKYARLKVVEIPDDVDWQIEEYDGAEWVAEKHRRWD